jgi:phosphoribosylanthranilate isomerase
MRAKSFVGIAGVSTLGEAERVAMLLRNSKFSLLSENDHTSMLGFQVSSKSMKYGFSEGNSRVPRTNQLSVILRELALETRLAIHYYTRTPETLVQEIERVFALPETSRQETGNIYNSMLVDSLQLNGDWPTRDQISEITASYPDVSIILQVSPKVTEGLTPMQVAEKIKGDHPDGVDYLILDPSRGRGIAFDMKQAMTTFEAIRSLGINSEIVFAGGFTGENVQERVAELRKELGHKKFSIDAEGGLRDKVGEGYGNDILNLQKVAAYLRGASEALR